MLAQIGADRLKWAARHFFHQPSGVRAASNHHCSDPGTAEGTDRSIGRKTASAARPFRVPILLISQRSHRHGVGRLLGKCSVVSCSIGNKHETAVERQIEPLMPIG
jgi:hypothetical protein